MRPRNHTMFRDRNGKKLTLSEVIQKGINRVFNVFWDLELYILYLVGHIPFHSLRNIFYALAGIKNSGTIHMWARFYNPANIIIGKDSIVGDHAFLDGRGKIAIGDHVDIASEVMIYNSEHDLESEEFIAREESVEIGDYVFIGPRVIIMPGVKIGRGAVVAGGAVVTKDVDEFMVVGGVPAKVIGERKNKNPRYVLGRARLFQ